MSRSRGLEALVLVVALLAACSGGDDPSVDAAPAPSTAAPGGADPTTTTVGDPTDDPASDGWATAGGDLGNHRAATGSAITAATVADLAPVWETELPDLGSMSTVPVVVDGVVYLQGGTGQVAALDEATGAVVWTSEPSGFNIGPFGVAVDDERVYALDGSVGVLALDRADGTELWSTDVTATDTTGIDIQPVVVDGLVLVSSVPVSISGIYAPGDRGVVSALDADTGEVVWTFDTVLGDDLWGNPDVNSGGGAWYPPAIDLERGQVYVGVANPAPFPGTAEFPNGTSRPGDNLYTDSIVALDLHSGSLLWYHQVTPHDLFDRDQVHAVLTVDGNGDDVVISAGKSGVVVGLDPDDGTVRWTTEVGRHENDDLVELDGPTTVYPGTYGGVLTPPAAADGIVYVAAVNAPSLLPPDDVSYFGSELGTGPGDVVAVDASDGTVLWSTPVPGDPLGGTTVVGDLVFTALLDGQVVALRRDTGEVVFTHQAAGGINGWMAAVGDRLLVPVGNADPPRLLALGLPG